MGFYINTAYRAYILSWRVSINGIIFRAPTFKILTRALTLQPLNQGTKRVLHYYRGSCWCCTLLSWFIIHIHFWMLKSKDTKIQMMCAYSFIFLSQSTPVGFLAGRLSHVIILIKLIFQNRTFNNFLAFILYILEVWLLLHPLVWCPCLYCTPRLIYLPGNPLLWQAAKELLYIKRKLTHNNFRVFA